MVESSTAVIIDAAKRTGWEIATFTRNTLIRALNEISYVKHKSPTLSRARDLQYER